MATTTTNYGFDIPQSTDLVKDGATAIATLGQDIDTAMNTALGTKKAGMVLLNTTSFSGVASQSFNNVFTSTYVNYVITFNGTMATGTDFYIRLRKSGTDATGATDYNYMGYQTIANSTTLTGVNNDGNSLIILGKGTNTIESIGNITTVFAPQVATRRTLFDISNIWYNNTRAEALRFTALHKQTDSYDGFTVFPSAGSLTGSVSVFGFNV